MILLNFSHPLSDAQLAAIRQATEQETFDLREIKVHFDHERSFSNQVREFVESLNIDANTWQTEAILVNPPSFNSIALALFAELNGRMGYFPAIIRLKPLPGSTPPRFEFAEIINLQAMRDEARTQR